MLDQEMIDMSMRQLKQYLDDAKMFREKLIELDNAGTLSKPQEHQLITNRNECTDRAGFILYQLYINGVTTITL